MTDRLKGAREDAGLTQLQLARQVGVSENAISRFETGRAFPKGHVLLLLAEGVGKTVEELFGAGGAL